MSSPEGLLERYKQNDRPLLRHSHSQHMKRELMKQEVEIIREEAVGLLADETTRTTPEEARQRALFCQTMFISRTSF